MQIFDMDGTLIDSNGIWKDVDTAFLAKRGLPYTKEYYEGVAHTIFPLAARFTKEFCHLPESEEAIMAEWMDMAGDLYGTSVPVKPGVREYLEKLRSAGERMIVVTSAVPVHCRTALDHLGLTPYFERIIFAQELRREKKDPQLWACSTPSSPVRSRKCGPYATGTSGPLMNCCKKRERRDAMRPVSLFQKLPMGMEPSSFPFSMPSMRT